MPSEGPTEVGSIIGYLIMDDSDWDATIDKADVKSKELGKNSPKIRIEINAAETIAALEAVRAQEDRVDQGAKNISKSAKDAGGSFQPLLTAVMLLGPTLIPLAVGGAAILGGLALGAGSLALGIKGVKEEMKEGTAVGSEYTAGLGVLNSYLGTLESTAAKGLLKPFQDGVADATRLFPTLNSEVAEFSNITGQAGVHLVAGLISGFVTLRPLLEWVILGVDHGAASFEHWTETTGGIVHFMSLAQVTLPVLGKDLEEIGTAVAHVGVAFGSTGVTALNVLALTARAINSLPISTLDHLATVVAISFAAWKGYQVLTLAKQGYDAVTSAVGQSVLALQASALANDAVVAAQSSAGLASAAFAVSTDGVAVALEGEAIAAEASAIATESAAAAEEAAAISMTAALGPIGLLAAGIGIIAFAWSQSSDNGLKAKEVTDSYTAAVQADNDAISKNVELQAAKNLQADGAFAAGQKLGLSSATVLQATLGNADAQKQVAAAADKANSAYKALTDQNNQYSRGQVGLRSTQHDAANAANVLTGAINAQSNGITSALGAQKAINDAVNTSAATYNSAEQKAAAYTKAITDVQAAYGLTSTDAAKYAVVGGYVEDLHASAGAEALRYALALRNVTTEEQAATGAGADLLTAMQAYAASDGGIIAKTQLLGAVLKASQGDALSFTGAMAGAYDATQRLISGFDKTQKSAINAKTGLIDYTKVGAGPLVSELQAMQSGAITAAQALYQHSVAADGDTVALQKAQDLFESMTGGSLVANAKQLGITKDEAKKLADQYFNVPKDLTTDVQAVGLDTINKTLDQLGQQLSHLTGVPWVSVLTADTSGFTGPMQAAINQMATLWGYANRKDEGPVAGPVASAPSPARIAASVSATHRAGGGPLGSGDTIVGEDGFEVIRNGYVYNHQQAMAMYGGSAGVAAPGIGSPAARAVHASYSTPAAAPRGGSASGAGGTVQISIPIVLDGRVVHTANAEVDMALGRRT